MGSFVAAVLAGAILAGAILAGALIAALGSLLGRRRDGDRPREDGDRPRGAPGVAGLRPRSCPLCSSVLGPGEKVKSELFPGKGDRIMHIFGCANCWPAGSPRPRVCPVCGKTLEPGSWVLARYFERPSLPGRPARAHVHVLGCSSCRDGGRGGSTKESMK
jgi:hypothetical protein